jgi:hypothetical protein
MALELSEKVVDSSRLVVTVWSKKPDFLQEGIIDANTSNKSVLPIVRIKKEMLFRGNGKIVQALARSFSKKKLEMVEMKVVVPGVPAADDLKSSLK